MQNPSTPLVKTRQGTLSGTAEENMHIWRGIPYAAPPVGDLRWRAPQPAARWQGVRRAENFSASSWQDIEYCRELGGGDPGRFSEDCLYLNVWSPASRAQPLPVMVWLHGGGYTIGAGSLPPYDGKALASRDVVVVTVNYRLGHLGFFAHPALEKEEGERIYNFALLDQIAALQWVQDNIHAFGGDAANVTLFGESAGRAACCRSWFRQNPEGCSIRRLFRAAIPCRICRGKRRWPKGSSSRNTSLYRRPAPNSCGRFRRTRSGR